MLFLSYLSWRCDLHQPGQPGLHTRGSIFNQKYHRRGGIIRPMIVILPAATVILAWRRFSIRGDTLNKDSGATKPLHWPQTLTFHRRLRLDLQSGQDGRHLPTICQQLSGEPWWTTGPSLWCLSSTDSQGVALEIGGETLLSFLQLFSWYSNRYLFIIRGEWY